MLISALVALGARRVRLPYTVGLVLAGSALAFLGFLKDYTLTKELVFQALLPPLIFEAAFFLRWKELRENMTPVLVLASVGVVIAAFIVGGMMSVWGGWPWGSALVFGALIAATDPVAVIASFKEMKLSGRLKLLVEAESLFNDGVAAVLFGIALLYASGTSLSVGLTATTLFREVGGGIACGAFVAGTVLFLAGRTKEHLVEMTFSAVAAFGSFLLADHFHCSGVLAVLVAGLMIGNLGPFGSITDTGRVAVGAFWEFAAFVSNSIIFLLIGVREHALGNDLLRHLDLVGLAIVASLVGRAVAVYGVSALFARSVDRIEVPFQHILVWGGLKGALSLALAIGLPNDFPHREAITAVAFGVVAFSVIVQGMTLPLLVRRLGILGEAKVQA